MVRITATAMPGAELRKLQTSGLRTPGVTAETDATFRVRKLTLGQSECKCRFTYGIVFLKNDIHNLSVTVAYNYTYRYAREYVG